VGIRPLTSHKNHLYPKFAFHNFTFYLGRISICLLRHICVFCVYCYSRIYHTINILYSVYDAFAGSQNDHTYHKFSYSCTSLLNYTRHRGYIVFFILSLFSFFLSPLLFFLSSAFVQIFCPKKTNKKKGGPEAFKITY